MLCSRRCFAIPKLMHQLDLYDQSPAGRHLMINFSIRAGIVDQLGNSGLALTDLRNGSLGQPWQH
jgi:hypothetical protein